MAEAPASRPAARPAPGTPAARLELTGLPSRIRRIGGVERILGQFGRGQLQQPGDLRGGFLHLGDVGQRRRGQRFSRSGLEHEGEFDRFADAPAQTHLRQFIIPDRSPVQFPERALFADQDFARRHDPDDVAVEQSGDQQQAAEQQREQRGDAEPLVIGQMGEAGQGDQAHHDGDAGENEPLVERRALAQPDFVLVCRSIHCRRQTSRPVAAASSGKVCGRNAIARVDSSQLAAFSSRATVRSISSYWPSPSCWNTILPFWSTIYCAGQ